MTTELQESVASALVVRCFVKGERMDAITVAGTECETWSAFGIVATVFDCGERLQVPIIMNDTPGSGKLDDFLDLMKARAEKPLVFVDVLNSGLARHLAAKGIAMMDAPADWVPG
jgi:hypothetical protein